MSVSFKLVYTLFLFPNSIRFFCQLQLLGDFPCSEEEWTKKNKKQHSNGRHSGWRPSHSHNSLLHNFYDMNYLTNQGKTRKKTFLFTSIWNCSVDQHYRETTYIAYCSTSIIWWVFFVMACVRVLEANLVVPLLHDCLCYGELWIEHVWCNYIYVISTNFCTHIWQYFEQICLEKCQHIFLK